MRIHKRKIIAILLLSALLLTAFTTAWAEEVKITKRTIVPSDGPTQEIQIETENPVELRPLDFFFEKVRVTEINSTDGNKKHTLKLGLVAPKSNGERETTEIPFNRGEYGRYSFNSDYKIKLIAKAETIGVGLQNIKSEPDAFESTTSFKMNYFLDENASGQPDFTTGKFFDLTSGEPLDSGIISVDNIKIEKETDRKGSIEVKIKTLDNNFKVKYPEGKAKIGFYFESSKYATRPAYITPEFQYFDSSTKIPYSVTISGTKEGSTDTVTIRFDKDLGVALGYENIEFSNAKIKKDTSKPVVNEGNKVFRFSVKKLPPHTNSEKSTITLNKNGLSLTPDFQTDTNEYEFYNRLKDTLNLDYISSNGGIGEKTSEVKVKLTGLHGNEDLSGVADKLQKDHFRTNSKFVVEDIEKEEEKNDSLEVTAINVTLKVGKVNFTDTFQMCNIAISHDHYQSQSDETGIKVWSGYIPPSPETEPEITRLEDDPSGVAVEGLIPENAVRLRVTPKGNGLYDMELVDKNNNPVYTDELLWVEVPVPEGMEGENLRVKADGKFTTVERYGDDKLRFAARFTEPDKAPNLLILHQEDGDVRVEGTAQSLPKNGYITVEKKSALIYEIKLFNAKDKEVHSKGPVMLILPGAEVKGDNVRMKVEGVFTTFERNDAGNFAVPVQL